MERKDGLREVREELPLLRAVDGGGQRVVKMKPFVGSIWFAKQCVVLEGFLGKRSEAI